MDEKYAQLLETIATKLGTTAEHLWGVLVRQAPIDAMANIAILAVALAAVAYGWSRAVKIEDRDFKEVATLVLIGASGLMAFFSLASINGIVSAFANPEYWALKQLLLMVPR